MSEKVKLKYIGPFPSWKEAHEARKAFTYVLTKADVANYKTSIVKSSGGTQHYVGVSGGVWALKMAGAYNAGYNLVTGYC